MIAYIFSIFFILGSFGFILSRQSSLYIYYIVPIIFFIYQLVTKKIIKIPIVAAIFYGLFVIFSFLSTFIGSVDKQISFELSLFYAIGFLFFIFFYNNKSTGLKLLKTIIFLGSISFVISYSLFLHFGWNPKSELQLIYPYFNSAHNHLGDFLGLALVSFVYYLFNKGDKAWKYLVIFFPFFIIAFSRSAYLAFFITAALILFRARQNKLFSIKTWIVIAVIIISLFFFFSSVKEAENSKFLGQPYSWMIKTFKLGDKDFTASRPVYLVQGWRSFLSKPFFGVGPGNFSYISKKYQENAGDLTDTAHSLFPEIIFENGGLAFIVFLFFILIIILKALKNNRWEGYLFLYLLINFQTDYNYKIYLMFVLLLILAALNWEEKSTDFTISFQVINVIIFLILDLILASNILLYTNHPYLALVAYPLNKEAYKSVIIKEVRTNCRASDKYAKGLYSISSGDLSTLQFLSSYYDNCGDKKTALRLLNQAVGENQFLDLNDIIKTYKLTKELKGKKTADSFFDNVYQRYVNLFWQSPAFEKQVNGFCQQELIIGCQRFKHFWQPEPNSIQHPNSEVPFSLVTNKMNADGLNDRFNYPIKKANNTFRIMVLGGSEAYGIYIPTSDNWTERLEDLLNNNQVCSPKKKFEIINLGVYGYDIPYSVERFRIKGQKYKPDLIIFLTPDFNRLDEKLTENNWDWVKTIKMIGINNIFEEQKIMLKELKMSFPSMIIFIKNNIFIESEKKVINNIYSSMYFEGKLSRNKTMFFPDENNLNEKGQQVIASKIFEFLKNYLKSKSCLSL